MKNKKGYTLIEMMTVVIILAVLALIVTPLIMNSIKSSKEKLYSTQLENIKSAAKSYMVDLDLEDNAQINLTLGELEKLGYLSKDIKNPKTGENFDSCIFVSVKNVNDIYEYEIIEDNDDCGENSKYIMILYGELEVDTIKGGKYVEPGVIVLKDNGEQLDSNEISVEVIQKKGEKETDRYTKKYNELPQFIKTDDYYEYEITYKYGKEENQISKRRTVKVKDKNNLQCVILPVGTPNSYGWVTDNRNAEILLINSNKKVQYSISKDRAKNYGDNRTINVGQDGTIQLYGYVKDEFGNESACTNIIKYEIGEPKCSIKLTGTKGQNDWYTSDVLAQITYDKIISNVKNKGVSLSSSKDYNNQTELTLSQSGKVYGYMKDEAEKEAECNNSFKIDKTSKVNVTVNGVLEGTTTSYTSGVIVASNVVLTGAVNPSSTTSGYKYQWYKDDAVIEGATNVNYTATSNGKYYLKVTTGSGIEGKSNIIDVKIDPDRPKCSLNTTSGTEGSNSWYTSNVTVDIVKGEDAKFYGMTNSSTVDYNSATSLTLEITGDVYCYVANGSKTSTYSTNRNVKIDKTAPVISSFSGSSLSANNYNTTSLQLTVIAGDSESGIEKYEFYKIDQSYATEELLGTSTNNTYTISNPSGGYNYKVKVYNKAGLASENTITESCSLNTTTSCSDGYKTQIYTCTTGRTYSATTSEGCTTTTSSSSSGGGGSSCSPSCSSGTHVCGCSCCPNTICQKDSCVDYDDNGNVTGETPAECNGQTCTRLP